MSVLDLFSSICSSLPFNTIEDDALVAVFFRGSRAFGTNADDSSDYDFHVVVRDGQLPQNLPHKIQGPMGEQCDVVFQTNTEYQHRLQQACVAETLLCCLPQDSVLKGQLPDINICRDASWIQMWASASNLKPRKNDDLPLMRKRLLWIKMHHFALFQRFSADDFKLHWVQEWKEICNVPEKDLIGLIGRELNEYFAFCSSCEKRLKINCFESNDLKKCLKNSANANVICKECHRNTKSVDVNRVVQFPEGVIFLQPHYFLGNRMVAKFLRYDQLWASNTYRGLFGCFRPNVPLITLSHIWITREDPDPKASQFRTFLNQLQKLQEKSKIRDFQVFYDYSSLPQKNSSEAKKGSDGKFIDVPQVGLSVQKVFDAALKPDALPKLFNGTMPTTTYVLDLNIHRGCLRRSWPYFELLVSSTCGTLVGDNHIPLPAQIVRGLHEYEQSGEISVSFLLVLEDALTKFKHDKLEEGRNFLLDKFIEYLKSYEISSNNLVSRLLNKDMLQYLHVKKSTLTMSHPLLGNDVKWDEFFNFIPTTQWLNSLKLSISSLKPTQSIKPTQHGWSEELRRACFEELAAADILLETEVTCASDREKIVAALMNMVNDLVEASKGKK